MQSTGLQLQGCESLGFCPNSRIFFSPSFNSGRILRSVPNFRITMPLNHAPSTHKSRMRKILFGHARDQHLTRLAS